ncbi:MAG: AAA-like domain-containing protein [Armatimonadetes bacterium]|nr:AAA-like domain-containing protein [Armatimonadota bacterium]
MTREGAAFYVTGGSLSPSAPSYVERQADRDLYDTLKRGELCYVLDTRQVGKSSLMVRTAARLRSDGLRVASLDLSAAGQNVEPEQWYMGLLYMLAAQMDRDEACEAFWAAHANMSPVLRFMAAVRHCLLPAAPGPLVVFIDEIDAVRSLPFIADELFTAVRAAYNQRADHPDMRRLTFCLIGVATPPDLIRDPRTTPFNVGRRIELTDFTPEEAAGLAAGLGGGEQNAVLFRRIMYWTGGHPYLTQRLCHAVASSDGERCERLVDRVCGATFLTRQAREVDDNLGFVRDRLLSPDAVADVTATLLLYHSLLGRRRSAADDPSDPRVAALRLSGVAKPFDGRIGVRCRIYGRAFDRRWVDRSLPGEEVRRLRRAVRTGVFRVSLVWAAAVALLAVAVGQSYRAGLLQKSLGAIRSRADVAQRRLTALTRSTDAMRRLQAAVQTRTARLLRDGAADVAQARARTRRADTMRIGAMEAAEAMAGAVASGLSVVSGRQEDALQYGLSAVEPSVREGREPPPGALQGLADAVNQGLIRRWRVRLPERLSGLAYSADGRRLAVCWDGAEVELLNPATGRPAARIRAGGRVRTLDLTYDGRFLLSYSLEGSLRLWDLGASVSPKPVAVRRWEMGAHKLPRARFCMGQTRIACSRPGGACTVVELAGDRRFETARPHQGAITAIATSNGRPEIATAGLDGVVQVFNDNTGALLASHRYHADGSRMGVKPGAAAMAMAYTWDRVVSAGADGAVLAWVWERSQPHHTFLPFTNAINCIVPLGSPALLALSGTDRRVEVWHSARPSAPLAVVSTPTDPNVMVAARTDVCDFAVADGGGAVELWRYTPVLSGSVVEPLNYAEEAHDGTVYFTGQAHVIYRWPRRTMAGVWMLEVPEVPVGTWFYHVAASPTNRAVVAAAGRDLALWPDGYKEGRIFWNAGDAVIWAIEWMPDGASFYTAAADGRVTEWDANTQRRLRSWLLPGLLHSVRVSRDGRRLVAGCADGAAYVWPLSGVGGLQRLMPPGEKTSSGVSGVWQAAWSPDGTMVVTAQDDGSAHLFTVSSGREVGRVRGPAGRGICAYFSPDGRSILTAGTDRIVRIWDTAEAVADGKANRTSRPRILIGGHHDTITSATWSVDGQWVISASHDATVRVAPATPSCYVRAARDMLALVAEPRVDAKPVTPLSRKRPPPPRILPP